MQIKCIKLFFLLCLVLIFGTYHAAQASISVEKNQRLQMLLEKARARKANKDTQAVKEESGYLPAENSKNKEVLPEEKSYDELVDQFNTMFDETKANVENHKKQQQAETVETKPAPKQEEVIREKPKTITKTTAKQPVTQAPTPKEKPKTITKSTAPEKTSSKTPTVEVKTENKVVQTTDSTKTVKETVVLEIDEENSEEDELEEDEFEQEQVHDFKNEDEEEAQLDEDEGLTQEEQSITIKNNADSKPKVLLTKAQRDKQYLQLIKKSLKSLEEDSWNEVKFNMNDALEYFEREKTYYNPDEVDKFYRITLGFLRFSEGGLELDQGDFADFEDAEAHYLDSQDLLDAVELKLDSKDVTDKELLRIIQTVKKYINEDIEYIEEMIDLS